ncbi:hypothetical protein PLESTB_001029200 [Pleodorina starrii]|uniref:Uncharacterized protein n=1 Tax=Pleodorina starrii TaxID=330485 RepID=A0A9W6BQM2_9CHLO|nr:hypothetical protein PLESTB_001029200 [Pleodorina starrii]GLC68867.1 hypothetical protein PLESTF_000747000 [Pleodorina starrii]
MLPPRNQASSAQVEPTQIASSPDSAEPCSPLASRFQINLTALSEKAPAAAGGPAPGTSDSDDVDDVAVGTAATCYPDATTPRHRGTPSFTNPLFDDSPCISPWTQPMGTGSPSLTGLSPPSLSSPTRRLFHLSLSASRHNSYHRRRHLHLHRRHDERAPPPHGPDGAPAAAAVVAMSRLLCRMALSGSRPGGAGLDGSLEGYLRRQLEGLGDDLTPRAGLGRQVGGRHSDVGGTGGFYGGGHGGERDEGGGGSESVSATLDLIGRNTAMQRQLLQRTEEVAALRLQLEEAIAAREELGLHYLESQEYISDLERRLTEEGRARAALAAQSQLLQEQLQEACEAAWRDQARVAESDTLRHEQQGAQQVQGQANVQQLPGHPPTSDGDAAAAARACPAATLLASAAAAVAAHGASSANLSEQYGQQYDFGASAAGLYGTLFGSYMPTGGAAEGGNVAGGDPRDVELMMLRRENNLLTQRLIERSMTAAQAREREEEARHTAHLMQEMNRQYAETVNTLSLELSLLRPNACGRARGVFSLPFLRRGGAAASDANTYGSRP